MAGNPIPGAAAEPAARVDASLAHALVRRQHPDLGDLPVSRVSSGWDNDIFRLGPDLCIRLPRRELAAGLVGNEIRWLPELAAGLPLPIPVPIRSGTPALGYPWNWSICRWVPGETALRAGPTASAAAARDLGGFLRHLHKPAPAEAPRNPYRGVALAARDADVRARLTTLGAALGGEGADLDHDVLLTRWRAALAVPTHRGPAVWVHGDLHPGNILMREGALSGVIDFGDMCAGDPAVDFAVGWMLFDEGGRGALRRYGRADEVTWRRARGWALVLGVAMVSGSADDSEFMALGLRTLRAACGGWSAPQAQSAHGESDAANSSVHADGG